MIVTDILEVNLGHSKKKKAYKIYLDYNFAFLLYSQDIKLYGLKKGLDLSEETYHKIIEETVYRRAKQKALAILKFADRTQYELYIKLKDAYYTDEIIDRTIEYLKGYNYLNDVRYASNYIRSKMYQQSKLVLKSKLLQKGIDRDTIEKIIFYEYQTSAEDKDPEILAINKHIKKKYKDLTCLTKEEKQKLITSLYRKGFNLDKIHKCLDI